MNAKRIFSKLIQVVVLYSILHAAYSMPVFAHVLKTDGSVGAVIHVDPDDEPHAGTQSTIFLEFHDRAGEFSFEKCDCTLSIASGGKTVYSQNFKDLTLDGSSIGTSFVFPDSGVYKIKVDAEPQAGAKFKDFQLVFDMRVLPGDSTSGEADNSKYIVPAILAIAAVFLLVYYWRYRR